MSLFPPSWYQYQHEVPLFYSQLFLALDSNKNKGKNQQDAKSHVIACFQYSSTIRAMITVLTPAYNRAYILNNLYKSLCLQNDMDFEWVIVDDGSSDNTESIVKDWIRENTLFTIRYFKQENGGKHRALNKGISLSLGDYIFIVDSDDYLTSDAISFINAHISEIDDDKYAGIAGLRGWIGKDGTIGNLPENDKYIDAKNSERNKLGLQEDKAEVYKRSVLLSHPFPEYEGENFIWEGSVWDRLALEGYVIRWYNHVIYRCKYLEDGLTNNITKEFLSKNFQGLTYCTKQSLKLEGFKDKINLVYEYIEVAELKGLKFRDIKNNLNISPLFLYFSYTVGRLKKFVKQLLRGNHE